MEQFRYIGQCDRLRMKSSENEQNWHDMMRGKIPITKSQFLHLTDMSPLLDHGETPDDFFHDDTQFFQASWDHKPALFFQTMGFEFIFTKE